MVKVKRSLLVVGFCVGLGFLLVVEDMDFDFFGFIEFEIWYFIEDGSDFK